MYNRNQLVHAVIWPQDKQAVITLLDTDGVVQSQVPVTQPVKGSDIGKMIPEGFQVDVDKCTVVNMSGKILVTTVGKFDTAVVTERAELSHEERMLRLERRDRRREQMEAKRQAEHDAWVAEMAEKKAKEDAEPVVEADKPEPKPEDDPDPVEKVKADET